MTVINAAHDISVAIPRHWTTRTEPEHGVAVAARARALPPSGFAPEVVLRTAPVTSDLDAWRSDAMTALATQLTDFDVEDSDEFDLGGWPVSYRRFAHRIGATDVVCEQWAWLVEGVGVTLTGSVARTDYADYGDLFEAIAGTVEIAPHAA